MDRPKGTELCPPQSPKAMNQELNNGTNFTARRRVLKGMAAMPLAGTLVACGGNPADATNTPPTTSAPIGGGPPAPRANARYHAPPSTTGAASAPHRAAFPRDAALHTAWHPASAFGPPTPCSATASPRSATTTTTTTPSTTS